MDDQGSAAPKTIGLVRCPLTGQFALWNNVDDSGSAPAVKYVRADIADAMLEALEEVMGELDGYLKAGDQEVWGWEFLEDWQREKANAAIAKAQAAK